MNYAHSIDDCVQAWDRFYACVQYTNRMQEKVVAAEHEFLNAVDEQKAAYDEAQAAFAVMRSLEPEAATA